MTKVYEIKTIEDISNLLVAGETEWKRYGNVRTQEQGDLTIFCYHSSIIRQDDWNYFETVSRGLIINNQTGEIVARPFDKFFNWLQGGRASKGHIVTIAEKLDGSLGILYRVPNKSVANISGYRVSTKGSFSSEQALWATTALQFDYPNVRNIDERWTLIFEIIYPNNRIVLDYGKRSELVLLAMRDRYTGEYAPFFPTVYSTASNIGFSVPKMFTFNSIEDILIATSEDIHIKQEGWVIEFSDGQRFKLKTDRYIELHRALSNLSVKNILKAVKTGNENTLLNALPDEFVDDAARVVAEIKTEVSQLKQAIYEAYERAPKSNVSAKDRRSFAEWAYANNPDLTSYLFALYDDKPINIIDKMIYKRHDFKIIQNDTVNSSY